MEDNNEDCGYRPEDSMFAYRDTVERFVSRKLAQLAEKKKRDGLGGFAAVCRL